MRAEIVAVGSELTSGEKLDTNSQWLSRQLTDLGHSVHFHTTLADHLQENVDAFSIAARRSDLVLITGGLGPTLDDLTRQALAEMGGAKLILDETVLETIRTLFSRRGRSMSQRNVLQAMFPAGSQVLENPIGTAPGIWMEYQPTAGHCCRLAAMPGVPSEMYRMFNEQVRPRLPASGRVIRRARINCFGLGESDIEQLLGDLTSRGREPEVGITAHEATITLRISAQGTSDNECSLKIEQTTRHARQLLGHYVYGIEDEELEDIVVRLLRERNLTVATVESGTGGLLSHRLLSVDGAGECLAGGLILPTAAVQQRELGLSSDLYEDDAGVTADVAAELAHRCRERFAADFGLAITTGHGLQEPPTEGSAAAFIAVSTVSGVQTISLKHLVNPHIHRSRTVKAGLNLLRLQLLDQHDAACSV
jgi:nicotinamide-nucleotide amidase